MCLEFSATSYPMPYKESSYESDVLIHTKYKLYN